MSEARRTREQAIKIAVEFLKARGIAYQELGSVVYRSREHLEGIADRLWEEFSTSDPRRFDPIEQQRWRQAVDKIKAGIRAHWSVEAVCYPQTDDLNPDVVVYDDSDEPALE